MDMINRKPAVSGRIAFAIGLSLFVLSLVVAGWVNLTPPLAPDFDLETLAGDRLQMSSLRGRVVLLNFWATWCAPCREEMPDLETAYLRYHDDDFIVVGVNVAESAQQARDFTSEFGVTFPIVLDSDAAIANQMGISGLPVSLFIDRNGGIVYRHLGRIPLITLEAKLRPLLGLDTRSTP
jgi:thiol-disulfide isomerase/thioredoxin